MSQCGLCVGPCECPRPTACNLCAPICQCGAEEAQACRTLQDREVPGEPRCSHGRTLFEKCPGCASIDAAQDARDFRAIVAKERARMVRLCKHRGAHYTALGMACDDCGLREEVAPSAEGDMDALLAAFDSSSA